jgi:hypothetical protein
MFMTQKALACVVAWEGNAKSLFQLSHLKKKKKCVAHVLSFQFSFLICYSMAVKAKSIKVVYQINAPKTRTLIYSLPPKMHLTPLIGRKKNASTQLYSEI